MPIIGSETLQKNYHRLTITMGGGLVDNVLISTDGLYSVYYVRNGQYVNGTGRIPKVVTDYRCPQNSYILFDYSSDHSAKRERIFFYQVQMIKDVTPNNAYRIAVEHGFEGTVEDWLQSLKGADGKSAYEIAVDCGYTGSETEWLESIKGAPGKSAYDVAVDNGYTGTQTEWLASLKGEPGTPGKDGADGKSAYTIAVDHGYKGTEEEWLESLKGKDGDDGLNAYELAVERGYEGTIEEWFAMFGDVSVVQQQVQIVQNNITWIEGMNHPDTP